MPQVDPASRPHRLPWPRRCSCHFPFSPRCRTPVRLCHSCLPIFPRPQHPPPNLFVLLGVCMKKRSVSGRTEQETELNCPKKLVPSIHLQFFMFSNGRLHYSSLSFPSYLCMMIYTAAGSIFSANKQVLLLLHTRTSLDRSARPARSFSSIHRSLD